MRVPDLEAAAPLACHGFVGALLPARPESVVILL